MINNLDNQRYIAALVINTELQQPTEVDYIIEYKYSREIAPVLFPIIEGTFL